MKYVWRIQSNALIQSIPLDLQLSLRRHPQMSHNWYSFPPSRVIDEDQQSVERTFKDSLLLSKRNHAIIPVGNLKVDSP